MPKFASLPAHHAHHAHHTHHALPAASLAVGATSSEAMAANADLADHLSALPQTRAKASPRPRKRAQRSPQPLVTPRAHHCRRGRPPFFRNSECLACQTPLGYWPEQQNLLPLQDAGEGRWQAWGSDPTDVRFARCANLHTAAACNWLVTGVTDAGWQQLCRCCRLTRTVPDLTLAEHPLWWNRIEVAKRRLESALIGLGLPVEGRDENPTGGMAFDLLRTAPGAANVVTGHADGVITLDVEEADDAWRKRRRTALAEPYRTLLGHLRHETGHYYWQRMVDGSAWLPDFRALFGDEQADYAAALQQHHERGAPAEWRSRHVSAYASCHTWEDWAETSAHYLHLRDTLDTARSFGIDGDRMELSYERFGVDALPVAGAGAVAVSGADMDAGAGASAGASTGLGQGQSRRLSKSRSPTQDEQFLNPINSSMQLTGVLNELSRSMGVADFYPFVLSRPTIGKLHLLHRVVTERSQPSGVAP